MIKTYLYVLSLLLIAPSGALLAQSHMNSDTWMHEVWSSIDDLDQNNDGKLSHEELSVYWERLYELADINNDDTISEYEWRLVLEGKKFSSSAGHWAGVDNDKYISASEAESFWKKRFGEADINHDGKLSKVEARALLESNLMGVYAEDYNAVFTLRKSIDDNNDGAISVKEFLSYWLEQYGEADLNNDGKVSKHEFRSMMESKRMEHESL